MLNGDEDGEGGEARGGVPGEEEKDLRDNWFRTKNGIPFHREEALD